MTYRVLVVDDYEPWRRHIRSMLLTQARWQVIGDAADTIEAIEQARLLQPDVILMDVSLPTFGGIEAARRILALHPGARILFLSEHRSWDIVEAALGTDACGYVVKSDAGRDLLPAMDAIVDGQRFISPSLGNHVLTQTTPLPPPQRIRRHEAGFYSDETSLLDDYARFAGSALDAGHSLIIAVSGARRQQIHQRLHARGLDVDDAITNGRYHPLDVGEMLSTFMRDGRLDEVRFMHLATALLVKSASAARGTHRRVAAGGDGVATLWTAGRAEAAIRLEQLWNVLAGTHDLDVFCAYPRTAPRHDGDRDILQRICAEHSAVHSR